MPVSLTTTTLGDGSYSFGNLRPSGGAGYAIAETPPAGYLNGTDKIGTQGGTVGASNNFTGIVLAAGVNGATNDFGELQPSSLSGYAYVDASDDGVKASGDPGIPGVSVTLTGTDDHGAAVNQTVTTDANGLYDFTLLRPSGPAGYTITEAQPAGYSDGKDTIGSPGGTTGNDVFSGIALVSGFNGANNNFGELLPASLAGYVYVDANGDGLKQNTEAGTTVSACPPVTRTSTSPTAWSLCRPSTTPTTVAPWTLWPRSSPTARSWASTPLTWCSAWARCIASRSNNRRGSSGRRTDPSSTTESQYDSRD